MSKRKNALIAVCACTLLWGGRTSSEAAEKSSDSRVEGRRREQRDRIHLKTAGLRERPQQLPGPAEVLSRRGIGPRGVVFRGGATAVQVNVDSNGMNIIGDAANESSIAIDPTNPDRIVIAWRQFDSIESDFRQAGVAYSHDRGQTWTATTLDPGVFRSDPVLAADADGRFHFCSLTSDLPDLENFDTYFFTSLDGGTSWSPPQFSYGGDKAWITIDRTGGVGQNHIYQTWSGYAGCCGFNDFTRSTNRGASFEFPLKIPAPDFIWGTLDVGPDGTLYAAGATYDLASGHVFARSLNAQHAGQTPDFDLVTGVDLAGGFTGTGGINGIGLLGQVWIAADRSDGPTRGNVYILGSVAYTDLSVNIVDVVFIRSEDGGETWSAPVLVNNDPVVGAWHWFGTMSVAPNGRIDVIWNDTRNDTEFNYLSEVFYAFSLDGGRTWQGNVPVTPAFDPGVGYPQNEKLGDYYHMISDNGGANLAFAATFNGEQDVYFMRIPADCNGNEIEDPLDVSGGMSDCNGNEIPDACEPQEDCDGNKRQDICDIAAGESADCNHNRVPDGCEPQTDCNANTQPDICDVGEHSSRDCNGNEVPDECDITSKHSLDTNGDGVPDECLGACCLCDGCFDTTPADCRVRLADFQGHGSTCASTKCAPLPVPHDDCQLAESLPSTTDLLIPFNNRCSFTDGPPFLLCELPTFLTNDLWFEYVSPCNGEMSVSFCDGPFIDTVLAVYGGDEACVCPGNDSLPIACGDDTCGFEGGPSVVDISVQRDHCYSIRAGGWGGTTGVSELQLYTLCATGACCEAKGGCSIATEPECLAIGGKFAGDGTKCGGEGDGDEIADGCDNCPEVPNVDQADFDQDGIGDVCDEDSDNDGVGNKTDKCPHTPSFAAVDFEGRPWGDIDHDCDTDLDDYHLFQPGFTELHEYGLFQLGFTGNSE